MVSANFLIWVIQYYRWNTVYYQQSQKSWDLLSIFDDCSEMVLGLQNCSVAFMDAKNGFLTKFHIEMVVQKKISTFFLSKKKYFLKMIKKKIWKKKFFEKYFCSFSKNIFFRRKKKLRNFLDYYFDAEFCQESISGIHKCNGAVLKAPITA